jgi:hypothetical protein
LIEIAIAIARVVPSVSLEFRYCAIGITDRKFEAAEARVSSAVLP